MVFRHASFIRMFIINEYREKKRSHVKKSVLEKKKRHINSVFLGS